MFDNIAFSQVNCYIDIVTPSVFYESLQGVLIDTQYLLTFEDFREILQMSFRRHQSLQIMLWICKFIILLISEKDYSNQLFWKTKRNILQFNNLHFQISLFDKNLVNYNFQFLICSYDLLSHSLYFYIFSPCQLGAILQLTCVYKIDHQQQFPFIVTKQLKISTFRGLSQKTLIIKVRPYSPHWLFIFLQELLLTNQVAIVKILEVSAVFIEKLLIFPVAV